MSEIYEKKIFDEIKDIMSEMNKITDSELAISEEEKLQLIEKLDIDSYQYPAPTPTPSPCMEPCQCEIPYCCRVTIPAEFGTPDGPPTTKDLFYKSNLFYIIDKEPCSITCQCTDLPDGCSGGLTTTIKLHPVRVVGCIKYAANAQLTVNGPNAPSTICHVDGTGSPDNFETPDTNQRTLKVCCNNCVLVDQVIGYVSNPFKASVYSGQPIPCTDIKASFIAGPTDCVTGAESNTGTVFEFQGKFKITNCPIELTF